MTKMPQLCGKGHNHVARWASNRVKSLSGGVAFAVRQWVHIVSDKNELEFDARA